MAHTLDRSDVPAVAPAAIAQMMRLVIDEGRALILLNGADEAEMSRLDTLFRAVFTGDGATAQATIDRFWALVQVLNSRRGARLLLDTGHALLAPAILAAATLRLNAGWGFSPQRVLWAIHAFRAEQQAAHAPQRPMPPVVASEIALAA